MIPRNKPFGFDDDYDCWNSALKNVRKSKQMGALDSKEGIGACLGEGI
jgi:hypothetical protein